MFFFLVLLFLYAQLSCCCVHVYRSALGLLPCSFWFVGSLFPPFACFVLFYWAFQANIHTHPAPMTLLTALAPPRQILCFGCFLFVRACTHDWQRPSAARFASFPCPNPQLCSFALIHTLGSPLWAYMGIPHPLSCACHVLLHFSMVCHVMHGALACVFGVLACMFRGVSPPHMP